MAEFISFQPSDFFNTKLYTGNGTAIGSGGLAITGVGFQPDFTWIKNRDAADNNMLEDAVRGATKYLVSNTNAAEATSAESLTTWGADGFTLGEDAAVNTNAEDYASWNWKAGTTSGLSGGTITPTSYSINTTSGIGMYQYDGSGTNGATIPHGLGAVPHMIWIKSTSNTTDWYCSHHNLNNSTNPWNYAMNLNTTSAKYADTGLYDTAPTSSLVTLGNVTNTNNSGKSYVMYVFVGKSGFSKFGSYKGNGNANGTFIYTGFTPQYILIKNTAATKSWYIRDTKRNPINGPTSLFLVTDGTDIEYSGAHMDVDFLSNGFKCRNADNAQNESGTSYIYMAFSEFPIVSSNDVAGTSR